MSEVKSVIWLRLDSIGDAVLSSSMLPYVKEKFGEAKITVVCQEHICELYKFCPVVDNIITSPSEYRNGWKSEVRHKEVLEKIRAKNPDVLLNSVFSMHYLSDMKGLEFIPKRYAIRNHYKTKYTDFISMGVKSKKELDYHCDFLKGLGIAVNSLTPQVWLTQDDRKFASKTFQRFNIDPKKVIVLFIGTREAVKTYNRSGEALRGVCKKFGCSVVGVGTAGEYKAIQKELNVIGGGINLSGKLTLRQTAAIIEQCRLTIGPDTGFSHIACAVQIPNVVILGGSYGYRFFPYSNFTSIVNVLNEDGSIRNVKSIPPDKIAKAVEKALNS